METIKMKLIKIPNKFFRDYEREIKNMFEPKYFVRAIKFKDKGFYFLFNIKLISTKTK